MLLPARTAAGSTCSARSSCSCWPPPSPRPAVEVGRLASVQRGLIAGVFAAPPVGHRRGQGQPVRRQGRGSTCCCSAATAAPGREGVRTDTVIVASIDTHTGDTTLFSLPRNLENLPFPPGSPLAAAYPNGFTRRQRGREPAQRRLPQRPGAAPRHPRPDRQPGRRLAQARRRPGARPAHRLLRAGQHGGLQPAGRRPRRHHGERQLLGADQRRPGHQHAARRLHRARAEPAPRRLRARCSSPAAGSG